MERRVGVRAVESRQKLGRDVVPVEWFRRLLAWCLVAPPDREASWTNAKEGQLMLRGDIRPLRKLEPWELEILQPFVQALVDQIDEPNEAMKGEDHAEATTKE